MGSIARTNQIFIDPVCCMKVNSTPGTPSFTYKFRTYYFCAENCRKAFEKDPEKYLSSKPGKKGWWGRYLQRLEKATGGKSMSCH